MGDPKGFLKLDRGKEKERDKGERIGDYKEFVVADDESTLRAQASRCMDCGIPFCHQGCPLGNLIPEWNDLIFSGDFDAAASRLHSTNNFPEVTGRVCPAPCEAACVLNIDEKPVTIKTIERRIADHVLNTDLVPVIASSKTGRRVAVVGSGPAGLAAAQQIAREGHDVVVFEKDDRVGGLLRYGIPDFKMEKGILDRRMTQMRAEGVEFKTGVSVTAKDLHAFDATVIAIGAGRPRDVSLPGRELSGIHFAMDFLKQQNRRIAGDRIPEGEAILATGKRVIVLGGGDTGSDCVGTSHRQGAISVTQLELLAKPSLVRTPENPWPEWPVVFRTSSSQEEGGTRDFSVKTTAFIGDGTKVTHLEALRTDTGETISIACDLVLFAMGFLGPIAQGIVDELGLEKDARGNVATDATGRTNVPNVFAAGDASRGQSLVVWAIADGRRAARGVIEFLAQSHTGAHAKIA